MTSQRSVSILGGSGSRQGARLPAVARVCWFLGTLAAGGACGGIEPEEGAPTSAPIAASQTSVPMVPIANVGARGVSSAPVEPEPSAASGPLVVSPAEAAVSGGREQDSSPAVSAGAEPDSAGAEAGPVATGSTVQPMAPVQPMAQAPTLAEPSPSVSPSPSAGGQATAMPDPVTLPPEVEPVRGVECEANLSSELAWKKLNWAGLSQTRVPTALKIFAASHPDCDDYQAECESARSAQMMHIPVDVYLLDSERWTQPEQVYVFLKLVNEYYIQASIQFDFEFRQDTDYPGLEEDINQLTLVFGRAIRSPANAVPDGFGNLPRGKAVLNDSLLERPRRHMNELFNPGKPIGHELGHVLGLSHNTDRALLMSQGTSADNDFDLLPEQALIMRTLGMVRFGAKLDPARRCPK